ncbi:Pyridinium-3,5-biscarboxylic acid mononucleotide synthase [Candidatus Magnetomoraceae bacterium gMMP-15]
MNSEQLKKLLDSVALGKTSVDEAASQLRNISFENLGYAHVDHHRSIRKGVPEVIFGESKTKEQIIGILNAMISQEKLIIITRINHNKALAVLELFPDAAYYDDARMVIWKDKPVSVKGKGTIGVVSAGTSDIPVAREAILTAQAMGNRVESVFDVGVAGIHRLLNYKNLLDNASVLVVAAGMEGALPSVIAGLVSCPVIAVPTSVGYGVSFGGLTALFAMLNSCASNVAVVNIDNGFGAGYLASIINKGFSPTEI